MADDLQANPLHSFFKHRIHSNKHMGSLVMVLYRAKECMLSHIQEHSISRTVEGVQEDLVAVEQALLAFVTEACPEGQDRDLLHNAACCLIHFAQTSPADIHQHNCESESSKQASRCFPPVVLRSFRALQPLLGPEGVSDALTVLRALHCRMQHLSGTQDQQPEVQAPPMVTRAPEAHWLPPSTLERPIGSEATAQRSSEGSCMATRDAPVCSDHSGPEAADSAGSNDTVKQRPAEQSQLSGEAKGDRQLSSGTQQAEAEEAQPDAKARPYCNIKCRQMVVCLVHACVWQMKPHLALTERGACMQATAKVRTARAGHLPAARAGHDVHALRGEALRQSDVIADLRSRMASNEVRNPFYMQLQGHCSYLRAYSKVCCLCSASLPLHLLAFY